MGWSEWPAWVKGGVIFSGLYFILLGVAYLLIYMFDNNMTTLLIFVGIISAGTFFLYLFETFTTLHLSTGGYVPGATILGWILIFIIYFIIGAIIGFIVGKIKSRDEVQYKNV